jgi:hypothetical protein
MAKVGVNSIKMSKFVRKAPNKGKNFKVQGGKAPDKGKNPNKNNHPIRKPQGSPATPIHAK